MLQGDAVPLENHQGLPVQWRGAGLWLLGHCEVQLSPIGGHLDAGWTGAQWDPMVGSVPAPAQCLLLCSLGDHGTPVPQPLPVPLLLLGAPSTFPAPAHLVPPEA